MSQPPEKSRHHLWHP